MPGARRYPIRQWIWRAFVQSALIPLILVESVLITVYLLSNAAIRDAQIEHCSRARWWICPPLRCVKAR